MVALDLEAGAFSVVPVVVMVEAAVVDRRALVWYGGAEVNATELVDRWTDEEEDTTFVVERRRVRSTINENEAKYADDVGP